MTFLKYAFVAAVLIYLCVLALMVTFQRQLQYFPARKALLPQAVGLKDVAVVPLTAADGTRVVLWYAAPAPGKPTILYFQGNAGEIADRADRFAFYQSRGFGVAFLSYRGYGASEGTPSEAGLIADASAGYDWLIGQGTGPGQIVLVGESLGTGVAVQLAAMQDVAAVVLEAPYSSAVDVAAELYWWLPVRLLMRDQFRSIDHIGAVTAPLLVLHGQADAVIPFSQGQKLFNAAPGPKSFVPLPELGHEALFSPATWAREVAFIDGLD